MKKYKYIWLMVCSLIVGQVVNAQSTIGSKPHSYDKNLKINKTNRTKDANVAFKINNIEKLLKENWINDSLVRLFKFGYSIQVNFTLSNSGEWLELDNGDRIWRLTVSCSNAKSISFDFDKFWLPEGSSLFIYDANKSKYIGGFTSKNNRGTKENPGKFENRLNSEKVVVEYFEPKTNINQGILSISKVILGYKDSETELSNLPGVNAIGSCECNGYRENCEVDVNCSEGKNPSWQIEKTSVAKIVRWFKIENGILVQNGDATCTGSLLNNVKNDGKLYFLLANHCIEHQNDAVEGNQKYLDWLFYWNYENSECEKDNQIAQAYVTRGATVIANSGFYRVLDTLGNPVFDNKGNPVYDTHAPDFALLELKQSPYDQGFQAYYNGWDRNLPTYNDTLVGIHHPDGKPKKISKGNFTGFNPYDIDSTTNVDWAITVSGKRSRLFLNSSGSPIFNKNHRVIGQCWSAFPVWASAPFPSWYNDSTFYADGNYGSFFKSWNYIRNPTYDNPDSTISDKRVRLKDWLDPLNTNVMYSNGMTCNPEIISNITYTTNTNITKCQIRASNVVIKNNSSIIFNVANGVYIPSSFEVQKGSSFEVQLNK